MQSRFLTCAQYFAYLNKGTVSLNKRANHQNKTKISFLWWFPQLAIFTTPLLQLKKLTSSQWERSFKSKYPSLHQIIIKTFTNVHPNPWRYLKKEQLSKVIPSYLFFTFFSASLKAGVTLAVCQSRCRTGVASSKVQASETSSSLKMEVKTEIDV